MKIDERKVIKTSELLQELDRNHPWSVAEVHRLVDPLQEGETALGLRLWAPPLTLDMGKRQLKAWVAEKDALEERRMFNANVPELAEAYESIDGPIDPKSLQRLLHEVNARCGGNLTPEQLEELRAPVARAEEDNRVYATSRVRLKTFLFNHIRDKTKAHLAECAKECRHPTIPPAMKNLVARWSRAEQWKVGPRKASRPVDGLASF